MKKWLQSIILCVTLVASIFAMNTSTIQAQEKLNFLLVGVDSGYEEGRDEDIVGSRADAIMIATLDPAENTLTLSSIPRDTLVEIPGRGPDKANHAFAYGGIDLTEETIADWLDIEFDHYVVANMTGYVKIVDILGGLKVVPPTSFDWNGIYQFEKGKDTKLDGDRAIAYARERYYSGGDYARQGRMRDMVASAVNKVIAEGNIEKYRDDFDDRFEYIVTDLEFDQIVELFDSYANEDLEIKQFQLTGKGQNEGQLGYVDVTNESSLEGLKEIVQ